jgi:hypothetical protein
VQFADLAPLERRVAILNRLQSALATGDFCDPRKHRLGLLVVLGRGTAPLEQAKAGVDLAQQCQLSEVFLDGPVLRSAREAISLPGLLNYFTPEALADLLQHAAAQDVRPLPKERTDPATTARHVWAGLTVARNMGFELGKYGLVPLTLEEQKEVIARIQYWFQNWCAAPVCYVDYPIVTANNVFYGDHLTSGIQRWLEMVAKLHVKVVLIDTAKKAEGRHLLKESAKDTHGFLSLDEIRKLDTLATKLGVKSLWAGGITLPQVLEFGKLNVFGIYVTSAAATLKPLGRRYRLDPFLTGAREPTAGAVQQVNLLLQAGFLVSRLQSLGLSNQAVELEATARRFLAHLAKKDGSANKDEVELHTQAVAAWKIHFKQAKTERG